MAAAAVALAAFLIDLATQQVYLISDLPSHAPMRRGKRLHKATAYRWAKHGSRACDGRVVYLPTIRVGGAIYTSSEAFQWFSEQLTTPEGHSIPALGKGDQSQRRAEAQARTDRALDAMSV